MCPLDGCPGIVSPDYIVFAPKEGELDSRFLDYFVHSQIWCDFVTRSGTGSVRERIYFRELGQLRAKFPPLAEQEAIAEILGALGDKIELNRKMNQTVDELARTIFRSWFVDFDPVWAKVEGRAPSGMDTATAALFPDRLVDSPIGPIPEGWEVATIDTILDMNPRRTLRSGEEASFLEMKNVATSGHRPLGWDCKPATGGARFQNGDTLLARITPCLENGKTTYVDFLNEGEIGFGSTEYIVLRSRDHYPDVLSYFYARDEQFRSFAIQNMTGTSGRQRVNASSLAMFQTVVPPASVAEAFGCTVDPFLALVRANDEESRSLAALRETLLPELISGRIRVPDAEKLAAGVV